MNESRPNQKSPFRPMMMILALIIVVPLLLCGGLLTWFFGRQSMASRELQVRSQQLRQDGKPVDSKSLQALHESLTSDQLTKRWSRTIDVVTSEEFRKQSSNVPVLGNVPDVPPSGTPWPQEKEVLAFLEQWESLRESVHEMAQVNLNPGQLPLRHDVQFDDPETMLDHSRETRTLSRLTALEFDVALRQHDSDRAFQCIQTGRGLQRSFDGEPILISQLIRVAIGMVTNGMLRRAMANDLLNEQQLDQVYDQIPTFKQTHAVFQLAIRGEHYGLPMFTDPDKMAQMTGSEPGSKLAEVLGKLRSIDGLAYLDEMENIESFPATSLAAFRKAAQDWEKDMRTRAGSASGTELMDKAMTFSLLPAIGSATAAFVREAESNNLARLAIEVRRFQIRLDRWPKELAELEQLDLDPRTIETAGAEPFGFMVEPAGVVVWGIERNEGATIPEQPPQVETEEDDNAPWVWRLPN